MKISQILALTLKYGDKIRITLKRDNRQCDAFFGGYRNYGGNIIRNASDLYPIFYEVKKDGTMSSKLLNGERCLDPSVIKTIERITPMVFTKEITSFLCEIDYNLNNYAHDAIMAIMAKYAKMHPGLPKVFLDYDSGVSGVFEGKYDALTGTVTAIKYHEGKLLYDLSTSQEYFKDTPDYRDVCRCGIYIEDEKYLLKELLVSLENPLEAAAQQDEDFFNYISQAIGKKLRLNGLKYYEVQELPGPIVTVLEIEENPDNNPGKNVVTVMFDEGRKKDVLAENLEPLSEAEKQKTE